MRNLFGEPALDGIVVELERGCRWCGSRALVIAGPGRGPHVAELFCPHCHRNGGWLPKEAAAFVAEVIQRFGRPTEPIIVRSSPYRAKAGELGTEREESIT